MGGQCLYCVWEQVGERHKNPLRERSPHPARLAKGGRRKRAGQGHPDWRNKEMAGRLTDPRRREASKPGLCAPTSELAKPAAKGGSSLFLINRNPSNDIRRAKKGVRLRTPLKINGQKQRCSCPSGLRPPPPSKVARQPGLEKRLCTSGGTSRHQ